MKTSALLLLVLTLLATLAPAQPKPAADEKAPLKALPYSPSLDVSIMDKTANPCEDFYQYSCGGWMKQNPIPPDQASWSVYGKLSDENQRFLWGVLEDAAKPGAGRTANQQKIGDYFAACMDETTIEKRGAEPLKATLAEIAAATSVRELAPVVARMQLVTLGFYSGGMMLGFGASQDMENSSSMIAYADAGGLGLPDRDYYTKADAKSENIRKEYVAHVARTMQLLGDSPEAAQREAASIMKIETDLAKASLTRVQRREPRNLLHKMTRQQLQELTPSLDWSAFLTAIGAPAVQTLNVTEPEFYKQLETELKTVPLADWKDYLRWHYAHARAQYLSSKFVNEDFGFYSKTLRGVQQLRPRWKRCESWIDHQLSDALGEEFVRRTFTPDTKARAVQMTNYIEKAMQDDIESLTWMGPETKKQALTKLHSILNKVGYPDKWRDYSTVNVTRDDFAGDVERANRSESARWMKKIGQPVDRSEWFVSPPTVDAYYDVQMNNINFPAGVLQPPLFDVKVDDAPNYGNTGSTIGHELTHGFDDEGRQFDAAGNLRDWWTKEDDENFRQRAACVTDQYAQYTIVDDVKINSKLTEGEDVADLGGTILAYAAWKAAVQGKKLMDMEGFTPDQRFFIGLGQWACENQRAENLRLSAITNPHSPGKYRINGVVVNMPEFQKAFSCKAGQPMAPEKRCRVW